MTLNRQQLHAARKGLVCIERGTKIPGGVLAKVPATALEAAAAAAGVRVRIFPTGLYEKLGESVSIGS